MDIKIVWHVVFWAQVDAGREHLDFTEKRLRYLNPEKPDGTEETIFD